MPLVELKGVSDAYAITIADTAHKVADGKLAPADGLSVVVASRQKAQASWQGYLNARLPISERELAARILPVMPRTDAAMVELEQFHPEGRESGRRSGRVGCRWKSYAARRIPRRNARVGPPAGFLNDEFGHAVGDEALKVASQRMGAMPS